MVRRARIFGVLAALLQSAIDIWYRAGPRIVVLHGRGIGQPAGNTLKDDSEGGNLTRMLTKGKGSGRRDDDNQGNALNYKEYPFKSGSFMSPTLASISSGKAAAASTPSYKASKKAVVPSKAVVGIASDKAVTDESAAKRHRVPRSILPQSLYSNANKGASELDASELVALELNKAKDWRKPACVPQLTAAYDDPDSSTQVPHAAPLCTGALLPGASSVAMMKQLATLRIPTAAQQKELNRLQMDLEDSAVIPKVSDTTNPYRTLADRTHTARVATPSRKVLEQYGFSSK